MRRLIWLCICILLLHYINATSTDVDTVSAFSVGSDNLRRANMYIEEMKTFYKIALRKQKEVERENEDEEADFYPVWLVVQNMNAAVELGPKDKVVMREVADMALRLQMFIKDPAVSYNETIEYIKIACQLDSSMVPEFQSRMKRTLNSKYRNAKYKQEMKQAIEKLAEKTYQMTTTWKFEPALPTDFVVPNPPIDTAKEMLVDCDKETKKCTPKNKEFKLEDYTHEHVVHSLYPTRVSTLHLDLPDEFNQKLTDVAVNKYREFKRTEGRGESVESINNQFFSMQAKSDSDQLEPQAIELWPELYRDSKEFQQLKKIARQACTEHVLRTGKVQDRDSLMRMSLVIWAAVYESGTSHATHTHEQSVCSGVYYAQIPENYKTPLIFSDPRGTHPMWMHKYYDQGPNFEPEAPFHHQYYFYPKQGDIVLFPSYLPHGIPKHETTSPRVVWAFNLEGPIDTWARMNS